MSATRQPSKFDKAGNIQVPLTADAILDADPALVTCAQGIPLVPEKKPVGKRIALGDDDDDEDLLLSDAVTNDPTAPDSAKALAYLPQDNSGEELIQVAQAPSGASDAGGGGGEGISGTGLLIGGLIVGGIAIAANNDNNNDNDNHNKNYTNHSRFQRSILQRIIRNNELRALHAEGREHPRGWRTLAHFAHRAWR